jgi:hypothetical protein
MAKPSVTMALPFVPYYGASNAYERYWNEEHPAVFAAYHTLPPKERNAIVQHRWKLRKEVDVLASPAVIKGRAERLAAANKSLTVELNDVLRTPRDIRTLELVGRATDGVTARLRLWPDTHLGVDAHWQVQVQEMRRRLQPEGLSVPSHEPKG